VNYRVRPLCSLGCSTYLEKKRKPGTHHIMYQFSSRYLLGTLGDSHYFLKRMVLSYDMNQLLHISLHPKKTLWEHDLRFVEEQLCSIVIEFLFEAKQNKTMCLAANLSWHLLKHFLNIKQINKQSNCQSINDDDSSMYWRANQQ
jgi:hypothetical protein